MKKIWSGKSSGRRVARDYSRRYYGNPLFMSKRRSRGQSARPKSGGRLLFGALAGILTAAGLWYAVWSPAFSVKSVTVAGASASTENALRAIVSERFKKKTLAFFPQSHLFFFDREAAMADVQERFFLDQIVIRKKMPDALAIEVREKTMRLALMTKSGFRAADASGYVIRELYSEELAELGDLPPDVASLPVRGLGAAEIILPEKDDSGPVSAPKAPGPAAAAEDAAKNRFPLVIDSADKPRKPGDNVFAPPTVALVLEAFVRLPDVTGEAVRWFEIDEAAETVTVTLAGDWKVMLTTAVPLDTQAEHLGLVLKEKIAPKRSLIEYVDLRYNEKIFYRLKEAAGATAAPQPQP